MIKGLDKLKTSIQNKESPMTVMGIIHGQIQPNLQVAFDLQLAQVTNAMPTSMSESNMSSNFQSNLNKTMNLG